MRSSKTPEAERPANSFPIVAIGASAGGLAPLERFLSELPGEFRFALVFMQHLSPKHKNLLPELLRSRTKGLRIAEITNNLVIAPGTLYLCPPAGEVRIRNGLFRLASRSKEHLHLPIDEFLVSLSEGLPERTIAVIFSGAGTDGARGVQAVRTSGGTVFIQDPATAEYPDMPLAAINTGQMDGVLPVEEIAREILKFNQFGPVEPPAGQFLTAADFDSLCRVVKEKTGHHFSQYKEGVIIRRVRRRMYLHGIASVREYLGMMEKTEGEAAQLASDLLIGVTSFFRDRLAWKALHLEVTRKLIASAESSPIRVWAAACASGEEAYSIAMMLQRELELANRRREIQIFATDVNDNALERARSGVYPASISADLPPDYLGAYFTSSDDGLSVTVNKEIRQQVVFARQDLLRDPPFSRMDLIMCRNLLIYLEPDAQEKCIALFHYALKKGGYLFLGNAESPGRNSPLFAALAHKKCRIYQRSDSKRARMPLSMPFAVERPALKPQPLPEQKLSITQFIQTALLEAHAPAAVAVNQNHDILYHNGPTNRYLRQPRGTPTQNLLELLPEKLRNRMRSTFYRASEEGKTITVRTSLMVDERKKQISITVSKVQDHLFLVTFREKGGVTEEAEVSLDTAAIEETAVRQLEQELSATRDDLQSHIEQLKSLNEELESSNEELQAANEELETSREELQSLNEELTTVNSQLQTKIEEQEETNNDLNNFLASTSIPTIFLDPRLRVKRFTPAMARLITLIPSDVGRPIMDMASGNLGPDLIADARSVLDSLMPARKELAVNGVWFIRTILPYRTADNRIEGVVVTYSDVTELKSVEESLRLSEGRYRELVQNANSAIIRWRADGAITFFNEYAQAFFGFGAGEIVGKHVSVLLPEKESTGTDLTSLVQDIVTYPEKYTNNVNENVCRDGRRVWMAWTNKPILDRDGQVTEILAVGVDITERKQAEEQTRHLASFPELNVNPVLEVLPSGEVAYANPAARALLLSAGLGENRLDAFLPEDIKTILDGWDRESESAMYREVAIGDRVVDEAVSFVPQFKVARIYGRDITKRKETERALAESQARLAVIVDTIADGFFAMDRDWRIIHVNDAALSHFGRSREGVIGRRFLEVFPEAGGTSFEREYGRAMETGEPVSFEAASVVSDRMMEIHAYPGPEYMTVIFRDITERTRMQAALRESEERVRLKLESILTPEGDIGSLELADIIDVAAIQSLMDDFYELAHIPMAVIDLKGKVLVGEGWQDICTRFHRANPETCRHCIESDLELSAGIAQGQSRLYRCKNNMWDIATPIVIGGQHMGNVFSGQFFFEDEQPDYEVFRAQARQYGFDEKEYMAALDAVPHFTRESVDRGMSFFMKFSNMISQLSYSNIKLARSMSQGEALMASLRESEGRYRSLFQNLIDAYCYCEMIFDEEGRPVDYIYLETNEAFAVMSGFEDVVGKRMTEVIPGVRESHPEMFEAYGRVAMTGRPEKFEMHFTPTDRRYSVYAYSVQKGYVAIIFDNITERKVQERRINRLARLYVMLSQVNETIVRTRNEESLFSEVCRTVAEVGSFPLVWIGLVNGRKVLPVASCGPEAAYLAEIEVGLDGELGKGPTGTCIRENRSVINNDFGSNPVMSPWRATALRHGFYASASFPLRRNGVTAGAFALYAREPGAFDADEVGLLESLSADISYALDSMETERLRMESEEALRMSEERFRNMFNRHRAVMLLIDSESGSIVDANDAAAEFYGYTRQQFSSLKIEEINQLSEGAVAAERQKAAVGQRGHFIFPHRLADGRIRWVEVYSTPFEAGGRTLLFSVIHDVTERRQAEEEREAAVAFLRLINETRTKGELLHTAADFFQAKSGCEAVGIRMKEGDDYPYYETRGLAEEFVLAERSLCLRDGEGCAVCNSDGYPIMECMCGNVIQLRFDPSKPFFTERGSFWTNSTSRLLATSTEEDRQTRTRNRCNGEGYESVALIALRIADETLGLLQLNDRRENRFTEEGIASFERLSGYLSVALAKVEAEEALKKANDELERRVEARTEELRKAYEQLVKQTNERDVLETQLRQAHKMEAIGTLAGGIAHDFNNTLAAIIGFTEMALEDVPDQPHVGSSLQKVLKSAMRARDLVKQILSFSRKAEYVRNALSLSPVIKETVHLLRASIPTTVEIRLSITASSDTMLASPVEVQQILMNLATNAALAMQEKGGVLEISLHDIDVPRGSAIVPGNGEPCEYLQLVVKDTGAGMAPEIMKRIFEPFFTTREVGKGTGMGLAVVYGIVEGLNGTITVESEVGAGSTFRVTLPKLRVEAQEDAVKSGSISGGSERILFVDDEELLAEWGRATLERLGYEVVAIGDSKEAFEVFYSDPSRFDLVITDQAMPRMSGLSLAAELMRIRTDIPIILCTGYSDSVSAEKAEEEGIDAFLMKPLARQELAEVVRRVLDKKIAGRA